MTVAFAPPPASSCEAVKAKSALPQFKPRWWYSDRRLDARPVIWSLLNRPEDWEYKYPDRSMKLIHKPSGHDIWHHFIMGYQMDGRGCSCSSRRSWQAFQTIPLGIAIAMWKRWERKHRQPDGVDEQFYSHFVH